MSYEAGAIPSLSIICTIISILICFGVPLILIIVFKKKAGSSIRSVLTGAITFILFALILEQVSHLIFLVIDWPVSRFINAMPFAYAIYGALAAGLFEETGRFVAMSTVLKKQNNRGTALGYGIGHGGIEAILIGGLSAVSTLVLLLSVNASGMAGYLATLPSQTADAMSATILSLYSTSGFMFLVMGLERLVAMALQLGLSVLVFTAVKNKKYRYLFPVAILIHVLADFPAALYQKGVITNVYLIEGWAAILAIFTGVIAIKLYKSILTENDQLDTTAFTQTDTLAGEINEQ